MGCTAMVVVGAPITVITGSLQVPSLPEVVAVDAGGIQNEAAIRKPPMAVVDIKE
jgi:hypothetical protein